ncbi:MAG TPA: S24 family peptidase [Gemmatimonadaceae bacterium]|jgi:SOS-response transcriptional repressor LexA
MTDERDDATDAELSVAEALGQTLLRDPAHVAWDDARFLEWLAEDAREEKRRAWRLTREEQRARGEAMMARAHARRLRVVQGGTAPMTKRDGAEGGRVVPVVELGIAAGVGRELWDEPTDAWVEVPDDVPPGEYVALRVVGDSMAPLMHTGDTVLVRRGADVRRDTVIVARHPDDGYVCKRVSRVGRESIELASLAPERPPIVIPRDARLVVGTVMLVWCSHRH